MSRAAVCLLVAVAVLLPPIAGCAPRAVAPSRGDLFAPVAMRIHPIFTERRDVTGDGRPDGIEALVQFTDAFGDTTKATGTVMIELFDYRRNFPDPRGDRMAQPLVAPLVTAAEQRRHWRRVGAAYAFQAPFPQVSDRQAYVVAATFTPAGGGDRLFDRIVLVPKVAEPTTREAR